MADTASAPEIRAARSFLAQHGVSPSKVSPMKFAASAKELSVGFKELLRLLGNVYDSSRGEAAQRRTYLDRETSKIGSTV